MRELKFLFPVVMTFATLSTQSARAEIAGTYTLAPAGQSAALAWFYAGSDNPIATKPFDLAPYVAPIDPQPLVITHVGTDDQQIQLSGRGYRDTRTCLSRGDGQYECGPIASTVIKRTVGDDCREVSGIAESVSYEPGDAEDGMPPRVGYARMHLVGFDSDSVRGCEAQPYAQELFTKMRAKTAPGIWQAAWDAGAFVDDGETPADLDAKRIGRTRAVFVIEPFAATPKSAD